MRRRLRRRRRVRDALLLDLGALVYELHRQGRRAPELLQEKAGELSAVDDEVRGLEEALGDGGGLDALLAGGIVRSCASCGGLLNAGDRFCARCGAAAQERGEWQAETAEQAALDDEEPVAYEDEPVEYEHVDSDDERAEAQDAAREDEGPRP